MTSWPFQSFFHGPIFPDMNLAQPFSKHFHPKIELNKEKSMTSHLALNGFEIRNNFTKVSQPNGKRRYTCSQCPYSTDRRDLFRRHENIHRDEKPFRCYVCNKMFNRADHVKKHFLRIHKGLEYDVKLTKRIKGVDYEAAESTSEVKSVTNSDNSHKSSLNTNSSINGIPKLAKVLTNFNPSSDEIEMSKSDAICKSLDWLNRINSVKVNSHENQSVKLETKKETEKVEKVDSFDQNEHLTEDSKDGPQEYDCEFCGCAFVNYPSLHTHRYLLHQYVTNYDNYYPYNCVICGKKSSTQKLMIEHMLSHSNQSNYKTFCRIDNKVEQKEDLKERKSKRKQTQPKKIIKSIEYVQAVDEIDDVYVLNTCKISHKHFFNNEQLKEHQHLSNHY